MIYGPTYYRFLVTHQPPAVASRYAEAILPHGWPAICAQADAARVNQPTAPHRGRGAMTRQQRSSSIKK
jgi:hypothetical protein